MRRNRYSIEDLIGGGNASTGSASNAAAAVTTGGASTDVIVVDAATKNDGCNLKATFETTMHRRRAAEADDEDGEMVAEAEDGQTVGQYLCDDHPRTSKQIRGILNKS